MTRVLLIDFQYLTRKGMLTLIRSISGFNVVKEAKDAMTLREDIEAANPDLVILDLDGYNRDLMLKLEEIKQQDSSPSFMVISNALNTEQLQGFIDIGIKGILTKNCSEEEIRNGLIAVSKGSLFFCNTILEQVIKGESAEEDCEPTNLSSREYEVLGLITKGLTTVMIADELNLSIHTINSHRKNILKKLKLSSPTELVIYALESGLVKRD